MAEGAVGLGGRDEAYGQNRALRRWPEGSSAVCDGDLLAPPGGQRRQTRTLASQVDADCWERRSAGAGVHG